MAASVDFSVRCRLRAMSATGRLEPVADPDSRHSPEYQLAGSATGRSPLESVVGSNANQSNRTLLVRSNPDQVAANPATLLRLDPGSLDQRPPFRDLRLVIGTQRLRRLLFAGRNLLAQVSQSLTPGGGGQGLDYSRIEP